MLPVRHSPLAVRPSSGIRQSHVQNRFRAGQPTRIDQTQPVVSEGPYRLLPLSIQSPLSSLLFSPVLCSTQFNSPSPSALLLFTRRAEKLPATTRHAVPQLIHLRGRLQDVLLLKATFSQLHLPSSAPPLHCDSLDSRLPGPEWSPHLHDKSWGCLCRFILWLFVF